MSEHNSGIRKIKTPHFGEIEFEPKHVFHFKNGMLGFDNLHDYVLISEEETAPFKWLINIEEPEIGFPLISPWFIDLGYNPGKSYDIDTQVIFVVVTLEDELGNMTANLKAPVVLDISEQTGEQVILPTDKYSPSYIIPKSK